MLAALDDAQLTARLATAAVLGQGIGGRTARLRVGAEPVFVKRVPLTDLERRPEHTGSTANLFALPTFYQYGVGSTGFGAWRELAAHTAATGWVLSGLSPNFPILHHWRVLPAESRPVPTAEIDTSVAYWDDSAAVRDRLQAIAAATAELVLCTEYFPQTQNDWMLDGGRVDLSRVERAEQELRIVTDFLRGQGFVHFDAHPGNVLADGRHLYLADFGLTLSETFDLSPVETAFLDRHRDWDRQDVSRCLVNWLCRRLIPDADRDAVIRACVDGAPPPGIPAEAAAVIARHGTTARRLNAFYDRLVAGPKATALTVT